MGRKRGSLPASLHVLSLNVFCCRLVRWRCFPPLVLRCADQHHHPWESSQARCVVLRSWEKWLHREEHSPRWVWVCMHTCRCLCFWSRFKGPWVPYCLCVFSMWGTNRRHSGQLQEARCGACTWIQTLCWCLVEFLMPLLRVRMRSWLVSWLVHQAQIWTPDRAVRMQCCALPLCNYVSVDASADARPPGRACLAGAGCCKHRPEPRVLQGCSRHRARQQQQ